MGEKKTKLMLYSTVVEIEVEVGVELGNKLFCIAQGMQTFSSKALQMKSSLNVEIRL